MRILLIGNGHLDPPLAALGHQVINAFAAHPDLARPGMPFDVRQLWSRLIPEPDVLLVADTLGPQAFPYGLEHLPVPRLYYAVDVHLNFFWQRHYAALFDLALVAQKDYVPLFEAEGTPACWLPWAADESVFFDRGETRILDVSFIGAVDGNRPKRLAALNLLRSHFRVSTFGERPSERLSWPAMAGVYRRSKIVFNEACLGDLNFRVFEAMACGALLVTEQIDNGLCDLFTPGEHLALYTPETIVPVIDALLADDAARARIAAAGQQEVRSRHTFTVRMRQLVDLLASGIRRRETGDASAYRLGMSAHLVALRGLVDRPAGVWLAGEHLQAALATGEAEAAVGLAELMLLGGQQRGARELLAEARRLAPENLRAWFVAAEVERQLGDEARATTLLRGGIDAASGVSSETRRWARAALDAGLASAACAHALGLVMQEAGLLLVPGLICTDPGWPRTALDCHQRALDRDPAYRPAAESAASLLEMLRLPELSVPFRRLAVEREPADPAARLALARALRLGYRPGEAAYEERVASALQGRPAVTAGDAACEEATAALVDAALADLERRDWPGARLRLERALGLGTPGHDRVAELLALVPGETPCEW